ncbi:hypothetical protein [Subsaximicrobium wynnwilliamsii]|uniref:hypothetical protein n=1 Tax=Subsaximicrobium wynnwilliamsii TaxID=291179 RepID=UPI001CB8A7DD|nr:hypothetical protein [Subsaximicrobium wynnwilliamsii]
MVMLLKPIKIEDCPQFFTATILDWKMLLRPDEYKLVIIESLKFLVDENRVIVYGYVIMDNHLHIIWKPTPLFSLKHTQLSLMKFTAQRFKRDLELNHPNVLQHFLVNSKDRDFQFWQRNALCVDLYSNRILEEKLQYIHRNPLKAGMGSDGNFYRFSSEKFYRELGDEFEFLTDFRQG